MSRHSNHKQLEVAGGQHLSQEAAGDKGADAVQVPDWEMCMVLIHPQRLNSQKGLSENSGAEFQMEELTE